MYSLRIVLLMRAYKPIEAVTCNVIWDTHYDVQLSYPNQSAGIRMYNKDILDNFIGSQAGPLQCRPLGMVRLTVGSVRPCW